MTTSTRPAQIGRSYVGPMLAAIGVLMLAFSLPMLVMFLVGRFT